MQCLSFAHRRVRAVQFDTPRFQSGGRARFQLETFGPGQALVQRPEWRGFRRHELEAALSAGLHSPEKLAEAMTKERNLRTSSKRTRRQRIEAHLLSLCDAFQDSDIELRQIGDGKAVQRLAKLQLGINRT